MTVADVRPRVSPRVLGEDTVEGYSRVRSAVRGSSEQTAVTGLDVPWISLVLADCFWSLSLDRLLRPTGTRGVTLSRRTLGDPTFSVEAA